MHWRYDESPEASRRSTKKICFIFRSWWTHPSITTLWPTCDFAEWISIDFAAGSVGSSVIVSKSRGFCARKKECEQVKNQSASNINQDRYQALLLWTWSKGTLLCFRSLFHPRSKPQHLFVLLLRKIGSHRHWSERACLFTSQSCVVPLGELLKSILRVQWARKTQYRRDWMKRKKHLLTVVGENCSL